METTKEKKSLKNYVLSEDEFKFLSAMNQHILNQRKHLDELSTRFNQFLDYLIDKYNG